MTDDIFFPERITSKPMIYAYEDSNPKYAGLLKVGYTAKDVDERVRRPIPDAKARREAI